MRPNNPKSSASYARYAADPVLPLNFVVFHGIDPCFPPNLVAETNKKTRGAVELSVHSIRALSEEESDSIIRLAQTMEAAAADNYTRASKLPGYEGVDLDITGNIETEIGEDGCRLLAGEIKGINVELQELMRRFASPAQPTVFLCPKLGDDRKTRGFALPRALTQTAYQGDAIFLRTRTPNAFHASVLAHEIGHLAGIAHRDRGLMKSNGGWFNFFRPEDLPRIRRWVLSRG